MLWAVALTLLAGIGLAFVLLPVVLALHIEEDGEDTALDIRVDLAAWWGALGIVARRHTDAVTWEVSPRLFGLARGPWFTLGGSATSATTEAPGESPPGPDARPDPAEAEDTGPDAAGAGTATGRSAPDLLQRLRRDGAVLLALGRPAWRTIRSFPGAFRLKEIGVRGQFGLTDPAATGQIQGLACALREVLPDMARLELTPDFVTPGIQGQLWARVHIYLSRLLYLTLRFVATAAIRWGRLRISRWRAERAPVAGAGV